MCPFLEISGLHIPTYGVISIVVIVIISLVGGIQIYRLHLDFFDGCVLGAYGLLGAVLGSKALFVLGSGYSVKPTMSENFVSLAQSGGMSSGGVLIGLSAVILGGSIHKIDYKSYMNGAIFLLPLCQGLWKIGCLCAGCCYGIPYNGIGSIVFPDNSHAISGIPLFPVQVLEAILFIGLAVFFCYVKKDHNIIAEYWLIFGILRFLVEFLRNARTKQMILFMSVTQWIDIVMIVIAVTVLVKEKKTNELKV